MSITVCHGGDPIPKSPFNITVAPPLDLNKVKVQGLNNSESYLSFILKGLHINEALLEL